jgi:hypothetical protein
LKQFTTTFPYLVLPKTHHQGWLFLVYVKLWTARLGYHYIHPIYSGIFICKRLNLHITIMIHGILNCISITCSEYQRLQGNALKIRAPKDHYGHALSNLALFSEKTFKWFFVEIKGPSRSWSHGSWISNNLCNQCLSTLNMWVRIPLRRGVLDTTLYDKVCQWLATGRWYSPGTQASSTNKTDRHNITEILLNDGVKHHTLSLTFVEIAFCCCCGL